MTRLLPVLALLAACSNPNAGIGVNIGAGGVSVRPVLSGTVGGVGVSVSPSLD